MAWVIEDVEEIPSDWEISDVDEIPGLSDVALSVAEETLDDTASAAGGVARSFAKGLLKPLAPPPRLPYPQFTNKAESDALRGTQFGEPIEVGPAPGRTSTWMRETYESLPEPEEWLEQTAFDAGNHAESLLAGAAVAPVGGPLFGLGVGGSMAAETALGVGLMGLGNYAAEHGASPGLQSGIELAAGVAAPGLMPRAVARVPARFGRAPAGAAEHGAEIIDYMNRRGYDTGGATPADAYEAAIGLKGDLPAGPPSAPEKYINQGVDRIDEAQRLFPDPDAQPSLAQALSGDPLGGDLDLAGFNLNRRELANAHASKGYARGAYGRRLSTIEWAEEAYKDASPSGAAFATSKLNALQLLDAADARAQELWKNVPLDEMPSVDAKPVLDLIEEIQDNPVKRRWMPTEADSIREIAEANDGAIPFSLLQDIDSSLSMSERMSRLASRTQETVHRRGGNIRRFQQVIGEMIDSGDPGDVAALREARAATREAKALRTPVIETLIESGQESDTLKVLRQQPDIREAAYEAREMLGEDGVAVIREAAWKEIFGDRIGSRTTRQMRNTLLNEKNRRLYEGLFEPEQMEVIRRAIRRDAMARGGKVGTAGQAAGTSTGYALPTLEELDSIANRNQGSATMASLQWLSKKWRAMGEATPASLSIEELAGQDIELAKQLLKTPTPENLPALQAVWKQALSKWRRRSMNPMGARAGALGATRAIPDAFGGDGVPEYPGTENWVDPSTIGE